MSDIGKKRLESLSAIARYSVGGGSLAAAPIPCGEVPKQIVLTASDIFMYTSIWKIYFEEDLSGKEVFEMLAELGLITVAAAGTAYVVAKTSSALLAEISNRFGPVGWGVAALVTGSLTGLYGLLWILYCDFLYEKKATVGARHALPVQWLVVSTMGKACLARTVVSGYCFVHG